MVRNHHERRDDMTTHRPGIAKKATNLERDRGGPRTRRLKASFPVRSTVAPVAEDPLTRLAGADELPEEILEDIWRRGSARTRRTIAGRKDIPRRIVEDIITGEDGELIANWLAGERDPEDIGRIVAGRRLEIDRALAYQDRLDEKQRDTLSWSEAPDVLKPFLLRYDLTEEQRDRALTRYVTRERILRSSYGEELINTIEAGGNPDRRWEMLMQVVGPAQAALISEAAERGTRRPHIARAAGEALLRLAGVMDDTGGDSPDSVADTMDRALVLRDLHQAARVLARAPNVDSNVYEKLAEFSCMGPIETLLRERADIDVTGALNMLTCDGDPSNCRPGHAAIVSVLRLHMDTITLPRETLAAAVLTHADELPEGMVDHMLAAIRPGKEFLVRERNAGRTANLIRLISANTHLYDPCEKHPEDVLAGLARRGVRGLLGRHVPAQRRDIEGARTILANYQPAHELLDDTYYAALVAENLLTATEEERDAVYRLMDEWQGTLPDLLDFVRSV